MGNQGKMAGNSKICIGIQSQLILPEFIHLIILRLLNYRKCMEKLRFSKNWSQTSLHSRCSILFLLTCNLMLFKEKTSNIWIHLNALLGWGPIFPPWCLGWNIKMAWGHQMGGFVEDSPWLSIMSFAFTSWPMGCLNLQWWPLVLVNWGNAEWKYIKQSYSALIHLYCIFELCHLCIVWFWGKIPHLHHCYTFICYYLVYINNFNYQ